jgi:aminopeptidase-like protein
MSNIEEQKSLLSLVRELCSFRTAVVADENEDLFERIEKEIPIELTRIPSGQTHNGWVVPDNWRVLRAKLFRDEVEVFDGTLNALGVGYYSKSYSGTLDWEELKQKLVTNPDLPDAYMFHCAWQYRPWDADWRMVVPYSVYKKLGPGSYRVDLVTEYEKGEMLVAHSYKAGRSKKTIVFNSNNCHPHMANDGFAGTAILIRLMQWLFDQDTFYSYRLVIGPEHLGSVFYLNTLPEDEIQNMVCGVFEEMPGTHGKMKATSTFLGAQKLDFAFENALRHSGHSYQIVPWRKGAGNDETVWEAPGYEIPFVEFTRCENQFAPFREYHSNLDSPDLMDPVQMLNMLHVVKKVVTILEKDATIHRHFNGLICLSNPEYDLYMERADPTVNKNLEEDSEKWGHLLDCLFRYFDGSKSILEIANRHDLDFVELLNYLLKFEKKGLISLNHDEL